MSYSFYMSPNGDKVESSTSLSSLLSDDFGGTAINAGLWSVLDGGLPANTNFGNATLTQAAIGSGVIGITDSVAGSALTVSMGTTALAERWYLSRKTFAGKEDILVLLSKSQPIAANSIFIGLVEVDPLTGVPLLNPNLANEFTNRGGVEFGQTTGPAGFRAEAIGDSSSSVALGSLGAAAALTITQAYTVEVDARDIIVGVGAIDSVAANGVSSSRVNTQCPNDTKLYKLVMRFRNVSVPATNTSIVIQRILVIDNYESRVQVSSGEGDSIAAKAIAVNVTGVTPAISLNPIFNAGILTVKQVTSAATTNATLVKATRATLNGGYIRNRAATERYLKISNIATLPVPGTTVPFVTISIPANDKLYINDIVGTYGLNLLAGFGYWITGAYTDLDTTAIVAGDVDGVILYS